MKIVVVSLLCMAIVLAPCGYVFGVPQDLKTKQVKPGDLKGSLKDPQGKPFSNVELTVTNESGEVVQKAVTNADGEYQFSNLPEGNYTLNVSGQPAFNLAVTPAAGTGTIEARLPSTVRDAATGAIAPGALTGLEWTLLIIGGVGVAVAVPTVVHHNENDDHRSVSP